jgi:hypothetical protein
MVGGHLSPMRQRLRPANNIQPPQRRWRVRQVEEDELDEALLGLGTEKNSSSVK